VGSAIVAQLLLSHHPTGRIERWPFRVIVAVGYVVTVGVVGWAGSSVFDPEQLGCVGCPDNLLLINGNPALFDQFNVIGVRLGIAWLVVVIAAGIWRMVSTRAGPRGHLNLVTAAALGFLGTTAAYYLTSLDTGALGGSGRGLLIWQVQGTGQILLAAAMVGELWRARRARRRFTRLVVDLAGPAPGRLRDALAERLVDPSLVIAYPIDDGRRYVDAQACDVQLPPPGERAITPLRRGPSEIATLIHRRGILNSPEEVDDLVSSVQLGLENERLTAEDLAQLVDLRTSGARIVASGDAERRRIERDLHDGAQQRLVAMLLSLRLLRSGPGGNDPDLVAAEGHLRQAIANLRQVAHGVYPVLLKDRGLGPALDALTEDRPIVLATPPARRYPDPIESSVYLLVARLSASGPMSVFIADDGRSLSARVETRGASEDLVEIIDRARTLGGDIDITETADGVVVTLTLPYLSADEVPNRYSGG
jgi:signal transduction histidine kinase